MTRVCEVEVREVTADDWHLMRDVRPQRYIKQLVVTWVSSPAA